jgi:hypothetical protein
MAMTFPSDTQRGTPAWLTKLTATLIRARYRALVGDSNAAGKVPLTIQGAPSQTANLLEFYDGSKNGLAAFDKAGNLILGGATNVVGCVAQVSLSAAQIIAMYTTPVAILAAPATGTAIVVKKIVVELDLTATAFSGGGVVHFYYHGLSAEILSASLAAATVNGGAGQSVYVFEPVSTAGGSVVTKEVGIDITCASGVFAAGTGTAKVTVWYDVVTLG